MALEESLLREYEVSVKNVTLNSYRSNKESNLPSSASNILSQFCTFGVIILGGFLVIGGSLTIGLMSACIVIVGRAISPIFEVISFWLRQAEIDMALYQLIQVSDMEIERVTETEIMKSFIYGAISLKNVAFKFKDSDKYLIKNLNLDIERKSFVTISGPKGSGFSTLSKIILGKLPTEEGDVFIDGFKSTEWNLSTINDQASYISKGFIFNASVIDNITVFRPTNNIAGREVATMLGLNSIVGSLPNGYETLISSQSGDVLPNGFIQRLSLARCLLTRPRILILDEFDTLLDAESEKIILWLLPKLKDNLTIISFTTHPKILELADIQYSMKEGQLAVVKDARSK